MAGIVSYGAYIPFYRLSCEEIGRAWGKKTTPGEKAIAGADEDSITMAVEATLDCLNRRKADEVDSLYFASTTPPYALKQSASIVAAASNLRTDINTADFGHSLRSGTNALRCALDAVTSGTSNKVIVTASECQIPPPDSEQELGLGDGAAAFLVSNDDVAIEVEGSYSITSEFMDFWRLPFDKYTQSWEDRFINEMGYSRLLPQAVFGLMKKYQLGLKDFHKVVYNAPDLRSHRAMAKVLGFDVKGQIQDSLFERIGCTGAASAMMMLASALENAKPGERVLFANYGDGADAFILRVNRRANEIIGGKGINGYLESKLMIPSYGSYLHFRDMMEWEVDRRPPPRTSLPIFFRESEGLLRLIGQRCKQCLHEQFPRQRLCMWCRARMETPDAYDDIWLPKQKGSLFSYSMERRAPVVDLPNVNCVVDLEGGARFYGLMTDRDPEKIKIGMPMEFTFRKINDGQGVHNYFWKVRPVRG